MNNTIDLPVKYVLTATKDRKRVYYAIDHHSGGYPYWTDHLSSSVKFDDLSAAISAHKECTNESNYMSRGINNIKIGKVRTLIELIPVSAELIVETKRRAALAKLSTEEQELLGLNKKESGWCAGDVDRQSGAFTPEEIEDSTTWR